MRAETAHEAAALSVRGLTQSYGDFRLGPLDLEIEPGVVIALVGPNGAGKTTTLHAVMGLVRPETGEVEVFGVPARPDAPAWKNDVGFVGEVQGFYQGWTGAENLRFMAPHFERWDDAWAETLARRFELDLGKPVKSLSKGNRTKLALVAALAHRLRLLLLDEPTSGLDPVVRAEVLDVLWEVLEAGDSAIVYSTHVLSDIARLADELAFLRDGRLLGRYFKDELVDAWRQVSFRHGGELPELPGAVTVHSVGSDHQVVTSDHAATERALRELGVASLETTRMKIDDTAVEMLRRDRRVAAA
jgi:ABC-2 type transport system ATP-binding protein